MAILIILFTTLCLAYANGANDNFKGVATLFGSGTTHYRRALGWATFTTFLGSITAVFLAETLIESFSGKGLVSAELASTTEYGAAVALGAGLTVLIATWIGMPISTTHSLVGALIGAGWMAESAIKMEKLGSGFFLPLLVSPILAFGFSVVVYPCLTRARKKLGVSSEVRFRAGNDVIEVHDGMSIREALLRVEQLQAEIHQQVTFQNRYLGKVLGMQGGRLLDRLHFLSAGMVSFARGLNDTPKIAALLLLAPALGIFGSTALIGIAIALGGIVSAHRVAETMGKKITPMNHGQGFTANFITSLIVIVASCLALPVSTTHVSCGSLFGIGTITRQGHPSVMSKILAAWLMTLPLGAILGAVSYFVISSL
ncbi:MAG: phosphate permease [Planctomycetaceae bacterium]|nr:phosphate permease [Planctomycetaceae bacterium]|tara:strand:+ start:5727 stop:6839 length:1113 start_codon:yes stop_codon:yes gene_type:complete